MATIVLGVALGWPVAAHYRFKWNLEACQRELRAKGERLSVAELAPTIHSEDAWASTSLVSAGSRLRSFETNLPPVMQPVGSGHAIVAWQQEPLPRAEQANIWPGLKVDLATNQAALAQLHAALQSARFTFPLNYSQGFHPLLPHLVPLQNAARWLSAESTLALHEHRNEEAWESLQDLTGLAHRYETEPLVGSVVARFYLASIAASSLWEALQCPELQEPQLIALQRAWAASELLNQAEAALRMERALAAQFCAQGRVSYGSLSRAAGVSGPGSSAFGYLAEVGKEMVHNPKEGFNDFTRGYLGYWKWKWWQSYEDELVNDQMVQAGLDVLSAARKQGDFMPALQSFDQATDRLLNHHPDVSLWLASWRCDVSCGGLLSLTTSFAIERSLVVTAVALKRYQLRHGAYPAQLSALVPDFVAEPPRDPGDGKPLRYRLNSDGSFLLYSVGEDGVDDGGDPKPSGMWMNKKWWLRGRDVVWPAPASDQEIKAYNDELAARRQPVVIADEALRRRYGIQAPSLSSDVPATNSPGK